MNRAPPMAAQLKKYPSKKILFVIWKISVFGGGGKYWDSAVTTLLTNSIFVVPVIENFH